MEYKVEMRLTKVLIVDDHSIMRNGLRVSLQEFADIEVVGALGDPRLILEYCAELQPDVVLIEMRMEPINGITATARLRATFPDIQVVILGSDTDNIARALRAGALSYLVTDTSLADLVEAIRAAKRGESVLSPDMRLMADQALNHKRIGHDLTDREREVLALMIRGLSNPEIAERLVISSSTAKNHVSNILEKLGTSSRTQAVALAVEHRILYG